MATIRIEVTAKDIERGKRGVCEECPVALALRRALRLRKIKAGYYWLIRGRTFEVTTSPTVRSFMQVFDAGLPVEPFAFDLEIPEPARLDALSKGSGT